MVSLLPFTRVINLRGITLVLILILMGSHAYAARPAAPGDPLWLSLAPVKSGAPVCVNHAPVPDKKAKKKRGGRPPSRFESEHRPLPVRNYFLNSNSLSPDVKGYVLHPDSSVSTIKINTKQGSPNVTLKMPKGDGPKHGANNIYVVDQQVIDDTLVVQTAKWLTIHHSCGWGHDRKFEKERQIHQSFSKIPLEIVIHDLWDTNFHSTLMSGDNLNIQVLSYGQPVDKAKVTLISEKGWQKSLTTDGDGQVHPQLIRDYYPSGWQMFKRRKLGRVKTIAEYTIAKSGAYKGKEYNSIRYITTFPWRYYPAKREYNSYMVGLLLVFFSAAVSSVSIFYFRQRRKRPMRRTYFAE